MNYQQALDYIYSFTNFETRPAHQQVREDYTLDRIRTLLAELGDPQDAYPTVHIAGSKGKGSTAAMLASILSAAGYRTGLFTSPHLHTYRERVRVDGRLISEADIIRWLERNRALLETFDELTTFEVTTALAFDTFAREDVDLAVIEVGLGGRLDTTNVITPAVSVITPISLEHTEILGDTITEIAYDKAGIIKPGVPAVTAPQHPDAMSVIQRVAAKVDAPLSVVGRDWTYTLRDMRLDGQFVDVDGPATDTLHLWTPLIGAHEAVNATVAVAAATELKRQAFAIDARVIEAGLSTVDWPGRTEVLSSNPLIMVDGAHNGASAQALLNTVESLLGQQRIILIFGTFIDKKIDDMLDVFLPAAQHVILTKSDHPRAGDPEWLLDIVRRHGYSADVVLPVAEALMTAVGDAAADDLILATGSLSVAAEARMAWFRHTGRPLPPADPAKPS